MAHSFTSNLYHCIFSTKDRRKTITPDLEGRLWPYLGGIARENNMKALAVGGIADDLHILLSLPSTLDIAKAMQLIKGNSSKWVHDTFPDLRTFSWQEGYGGFSIGVSQINVTVAYIQNQKKHHRQTTFEEEFLKIIQRHGIEYDERFVWG
jgi:putative transposase